VSSRAASAAGAAVIETIWRGSGTALWEEESRGGRSAAFSILWDAISINVVTSPVVVTVELVYYLERSTCKLRRVFQFFSFLNAGLIGVKRTAKAASSVREKS
jgi:hypothetical protein